MSRKRVFVSSVTQGFADRREAARTAIEKAGMEPVLAEELPAAAGDPRTVILDEVLPACDCLLGIYGWRYGWDRAKSGRSPTEQEFDKARELSLRTYAFIDRIETTPPEQQQAAFLERVQNWDVGLLRSEFHSLPELRDKILRALLRHDISPSFRAFVVRLKDRVRDLNGLAYRETTQPSVPGVELVLHAPSSQFTAGVEHFILAVDGDTCDARQIGQLVHNWCEEATRHFQSGILKARNLSAQILILVERNPHGHGPAGLREDKQLFHTCGYRELLVDLRNGKVDVPPAKGWLSKPWFDPVKAAVAECLQ